MPTVGAAPKAHLNRMNCSERTIAFGPQADRYRGGPCRGSCFEGMELVVTWPATPQLPSGTSFQAPGRSPIASETTIRASADAPRKRVDDGSAIADTQR
jgi:hypothetical protein